MKKLISTLFIVLLIFALSGCGEDNTQSDVVEKKDFYVEIKKFGDFDNTATLHKTGKLSSTQNITVTANANGRLRNINVKVGDKVTAGQIIAVLDDNIANYGLSVESTKNTINAVKNSLDVSKNNLERAKLNYESTKSSLDKGIADIERNLNNLDASSESTSTSIEIAKLDNSISKLKIDYDNLLLSNRNTINGYVKSLEREVTTLKSYIDDIILFSDEILGVTELNKSKNDSYEIYLGAKNSSQKSDVEKMLQNLIYFRNNDLKNYTIVVEKNEDIKKYISEINDIYSTVLDFLNAFDVTLGNTVASPGAISDTEISTYRGRISTFKATYNSYKQAFVAFDNQVVSFLDTYLAGETSTLKQIENLEKDKDIYFKSLGLNVESSEATLNEAKINRENTLKGLEIAIRDAEISLEDTQIRLRDAEIAHRQAQIQYDKLFIKSSINGVVGSVLVDEGQEVSIGTPIFNILSESENDVTISFTKEELNFIKDGQQAYYKEGENVYIGTIHSISKTADENLKYVSKVSFPSGTSYIGNILSIDIPITLNKKLMPINALNVNDSSIATLKYLTDENEIEEKLVRVGEVFSDKIVIEGDVDSNLNVIMNYVDNYDPDKFNLIVREYE